MIRDGWPGDIPEPDEYLDRAPLTDENRRAMIGRLTRGLAESERRRLSAMMQMARGEPQTAIAPTCKVCNHVMDSPKDHLWNCPIRYLHALWIEAIR